MQKAGEEKTILLVEDEVLVALYESQMLQKHGFAVITAHSGEEAVEAARPDRKIDLVLMDINLGTGMDGTEAARIILAMRDVPLVFLSSHTEPEVLEKTERITSYGYVAKNSGEKVLTTTIGMAFRLHDAHKKLKESEERYRTLVETSPIGILIHRYGAVQYANQAAARVFGALSWEEFLGRNAIEAIHPDDREKVVERIRRVIELGETAPMEEIRVLAKDGGVLFVNITAGRTTFNGEPASLAFGVDVTPLKNAEREIRKRQDEQDAVFNSLPVIIWQMDRDSRVLWGNSFAAASLGMPIEAIVGKTVFDLFPHGQAAKFHADNLKVMGSGAMKAGMVEEYLAASGERKWAHTDKYPFRDEHGGVRGVIVFALDITERMRTEEKLRLSEEKYRQLFEMESDSIFMIDNETGRILEVNEAAVSLYGYSREEILALCNTDLSAEPADTRRVTKKSETHIPVRYHRKRDGTVFPVEITARHFSRNGRPVHIAAIRDISARIKADEKLRGLDERNEEALRVAKMAHWELDVPSRTFTFNDQFYNLHGTTAGEAGGYTLTIEDFTGRYVHPDFIAQVADAIERGIGSDDPGFQMQVEGRLLARDGKPFWVTTWFRVEKDAQGRTVRLHGVNQDVTIRKNAEEALERWLEEKAAMLRELQHRVKNSMAMISSLVGLEATRAADAGTREVLGSIRNRVSSLAHLYEMLYSTGDTRTIRLDDYLKLIISSLTDSLVDKMSRITFTTDFDPVKIEAQRAAPFGLILNELATNAIKYAFPGEGAGRVSVALRKGDGTVELGVSDNGAGLPESFDSQAHRGLGMQLVRMLSEQLGGSVRAERGEGTSFRVTVPINS